MQEAATKLPFVNEYNNLLNGAENEKKKNVSIFLEQKIIVTVHSLKNLRWHVELSNCQRYAFSALAHSFFRKTFRWTNASYSSLGGEATACPYLARSWDAWNASRCPSWHPGSWASTSWRLHEASCWTWSRCEPPAAAGAGTTIDDDGARDGPHRCRQARLTFARSPPPSPAVDHSLAFSLSCISVGCLSHTHLRSDVRDDGHLEGGSRATSAARDDHSTAPRGNDIIIRRRRPDRARWNSHRNQRKKVF